MLNSTDINEIGTRARENAELSSRTIANTLDVTLALDDMGHSVEELTNFHSQITENGDSETIPITRFPNYAPALKNNPNNLTAPVEFVSDSKGKQFIRLFNAATNTQNDTDNIIAKPPAMVPPYLPLFPLVHTYAKTSSVVSGRLKNLSKHTGPMLPKSTPGKILSQRLAPPGNISTSISSGISTSQTNVGATSGRPGVRAGLKRTNQDEEDGGQNSVLAEESLSKLVRTIKKAKR